MNSTILMGRLTKDPIIRYSQGDNANAVCRYSLAVERDYKREGEPDADFLDIVAFGKRGEFAGKYFKKGMKVAVRGKLRTGTYTDKDGKKIKTTDIIAEEQHFAESKGSGGSGNAASQQPVSGYNSEDFAPDYSQDDIPF